jgi:serine/threonine protein kinase/Tol biopolymer transport system component
MPAMDPERWRQVEDLYHRASALPPEERDAFVAESCGGDSALRADVRSLLAYDGRTADFLDTSALEVAAGLLAGDERDADPGLTGRTVGGFRVLGELGRGGMAVVYEAEDIRLGRRVALKVLPPAMAGDPQALERFEREARAASALNHPHICTIYSVQEHEGQPFIEMERLQGRTLRAAIDGRPLDTALAVDTAIGIADALVAAHARGIVHRDLKPGNVFLTDRGTAKILDFGVAKLERDREHAGERTTSPSSSPADSLTMAGTVLGTAAYMSPEQTRGEEVDARSDLFSVGAVLYEMVTGRPAFAGSDVTTVRESVLSRTPAPARQIDRRLPARLEAVIDRALQKDRALRYGGAAEMLADLRLVKADLARRSTPRGRRVAVAATAIVLAGIAGIAGLSAWKRRGDTTSALDVRVRQLTHNTSENSVGNAAFSRDGRSVAYGDRKGLHIRDDTTGATRTVPGSEALLDGASAWDAAAGWFPDGSAFVATLRRHEAPTAQGSTIWLIPSAGEPNKLRDDAEAFSVSPDGAWIAFGRVPAEGGDREVWLMDGRGEHPRLLYAAATGGEMTNVAWSPDGRRTAVLERHGGGSLDEIQTRDLQGNGAASVFRAAEGETIQGLAWFPDGRFLLSTMTTRETNAGTIACRHWQIPVDGSTGRALGPPTRVAGWLPQCVGAISASGDGRRAVFPQWAIQDTIYVASLDAAGRATSPARLTFSEGRNIPSGWTADGTGVVFVSDGGGAAALLRQTVSSDASQVIASEPGIGGAARLVPDGSAVLYVVFANGKDPSGGLRLRRVAVSGGPSEEVLRGRFVDGGARCTMLPARLCVIAERTWSGGEIVFTAVDERKGRGSELARFGAAPGGDYRWALSPDGTRIAVLDARGPRIDILSLTGQPPFGFEVKGWPTLGYVSWTADGTHLLVPSVDARGTPLLSVDLRGEAAVVWEREGSLGTSAIPSPDGRRLAIWVRTQNANIWMAENNDN